MSRVSDRIYNLFMAPLEQNRLKSKRLQLLEDVAGDVLEIGFGTGANLKFYDHDQVDTLTLIDHKLPSTLDLVKNLNPEQISIDEGSVMELPYDDETFDSIVFTLVFCTVEKPEKGIEEIKRVLKPGGRIYFIEHVQPIKQPYKRWFNRLTPAWKCISHGCHLNRSTVTLIQRAGFKLVEYHRFYRTAFVSGVGYLE